MVAPQLWEELDAFDTFTYLIVCPLGILASLALMIVHIAYKELRKQPGDLVFMIAFSEFLLSIHWLSSSIMTTYIKGSSYDDDSTFCKFNTYLALISGTMDTFYNVSFLFYIIFALRNSIQKNWKPKKLYHVANGCLIIIMLIMAHRGRNKYGTCSVRVGTSSILSGGLILLLSILMAAIVYLHTKRSLPSLGAEMVRLRRDFLNFYGSYIKAYIVICSIVFFSYFCQLVGQNQNEPGTHRNFYGTLFNLGRLGNTAKALLPLVLFFIRSQDPALKNRIFKPYEAVAGQLNQLIKNANPSLKPRPQNFDGSLDQSSTGSSDYPLPETRSASETRLDKVKNLQEELMTDTDDAYWMDLLPGKVKEAFTRTFLASILKYYPSHLAMLINQRAPSSHASAVEFVDLLVEGEDLMRQLGTTDTICSCRMTIQAPKLFRDILVNNNRVVNFEESFDLKKNAVAIQQAGENKGGASGELFMFSHDSQLIIKTISPEDEIQLTKILYDYSQYHHYNKGSMMAKILGMFQFKMEGTGKPIKLMVMENIFTIPKEAVLRKYDCKGSLYKRKVVPNPLDFSKDTPTKNVLKDVDFTEIDKCVNFLDKQHRLVVLAAIKRDVDFFVSHGLMDYSLIIGVIRRRPIDQDCINKELQAGGYHLIATPDPSVFFMIGIIDYLQPYTWSKAFERIFKRIRTCNPRLETSTQPPERYAKRFYAFTEKNFL